MSSYVQPLSPPSTGENKERIEKAKSLKCGRSSVVERQLPKLYVAGSIPAARSRFFKQLKHLASADFAQPEWRVGWAKALIRAFTPVFDGLWRRARAKSLGRLSCSAWARRTPRGASIQVSRPPLPTLPRCVDPIETCASSASFPIRHLVLSSVYVVQESDHESTASTVGCFQHIHGSDDR